MGPGHCAPPPTRGFPAHVGLWDSPRRHTPAAFVTCPGVSGQPSAFSSSFPKAPETRAPVSVSSFIRIPRAQLVREAQGCGDTAVSRRDGGNRGSVGAPHSKVQCGFRVGFCGEAGRSPRSLKVPSCCRAPSAACVESRAPGRSKEISLAAPEGDEAHGEMKR